MITCGDGRDILCKEKGVHIQISRAHPHVSNTLTVRSVSYGKYRWRARAGVRRSVLLCMASVMSTASRWGLMEDSSGVAVAGNSVLEDISEAVAWMAVVATADPNPSCRALASKLVGTTGGTV